MLMTIQFTTQLIHITYKIGAKQMMMLYITDINNKTESYVKILSF